MNALVPATLLPAAKASGRCPPSLMRHFQVIDGGAFETALLRALDGASQGLILSLEPDAPDNFTNAMKLASGSSDTSILEQRRCLLLAAIGSTAENMPSNSTLNSLLKAGLLVTLKSWLEENLAGKVGGVDLLLHFLTNIALLPVTKLMVTSSRLGKTVSSVEKHNICVGGANEAAIKSKIKHVKERWSASVKSFKKNENASMKRPPDETTTQPATASTKRSPDEHASPVAKKAKQEGSSLSNLLKKVENTNNVAQSSTMTAAEIARAKKQEQDLKLEETPANANAKLGEPKEDAETGSKKEERRIHWADNSGQALVVSNNGAADAATNSEPARASRWSERTKQDIKHEKEMLLQSRKSGLVDDDKEDLLNAMAMMATWKQPQPLVGLENPPVTIKSNETSTQSRRMSTTPTVRYSSENEVPISPTLLTEAEKALELSLRNSSAPFVIPFFIPQAAPNPAYNGNVSNNFTPAFSPANPPSEATLETVLMMGLPLFLVGSNLQALQALASNPGLVASFKDMNGVYKQQELINLVQTLTQNLAPQVNQQNVMPGYAVATQAYTAAANPVQTGTAHQMHSVGVNPVHNAGVNPVHATAVNSLHTAGANQVHTVAPHSVHPAAVNPVQNSYTQQQPNKHQGSRGGYRGDQNDGDANLHLSGYGPTTSNAEIIALFSPYVHVVEVVNKNGFSFLNTNDAAGAKRAKEALSGCLLGGLPCRINFATRKERNPNYGGGGRGRSSGGSSGGPSAPPRNSSGQIDFGKVKDDRGNRPTKNLFVAGYGPGTTEKQIKDLFSQHANVVSVVMKGTFSFVNTSARDSAVMARSALSDQQLNGGALRINFAKETGRLGTSFDSTYGPASASTYGGRY